VSWDIFVQDIPASAESASDIPDDFRPRPLGNRRDVIRRILEVDPTAVFDDPSWGTFSGDGFSVEFNMGTEEALASFALHVRGGSVAAGLAVDLLTRCGWRALDPQSPSGIFDPDRALESLAAWRAYRDRVLGEPDAS
jgi:hypothetical protein